MTSLPRRLSWAPAALLTALLLSVACDDDITSSTPFSAEEPFSTTVDAAGVVVLDLNGINGTIIIAGSATADSIEVEAVKRVNADSQAAADEWLDSLEVQVTTSAGAVAVTSVHPPSAQGRNFVIDYEITIPETVRVVIDNANGAITVTGIGARVDITNGNGAVDLVDIVGNVTIELGNGEVDAQVTIGAGGTIDVTVGNGDVVLSIPQETSAQFSAAVGNGSITLVGLSLTDQVATNTSLIGRLGTGDGDIQLATGNGTITVVGF